MKIKRSIGKEILLKDVPCGGCFECNGVLLLKGDTLKGETVVCMSLVTGPYAKCRLSIK